MMINYFTLVTFHTHILLHTVPAFTETKSVLIDDLLYTPTYTDRSNGFLLCNLSIFVGLALG